MRRWEADSLNPGTGRVFPARTRPVLRGRLHVGERARMQVLGTTHHHATSIVLATGNCSNHRCDSGKDCRHAHRNPGVDANENENNKNQNHGDNRDNCNIG